MHVVCLRPAAEAGPLANMRVAGLAGADSSVRVGALAALTLAGMALSLHRYLS